MRRQRTKPAQANAQSTVVRGEKPNEKDHSLSEWLWSGVAWVMDGVVNSLRAARERGWLRALGQILFSPWSMLALLILVILFIIEIGVQFGPLRINLPAGGPGPTAKVQGRPAPTATLLPSPTPSPTPTQTELDGVITIENLDQNNPFDGDVSVTADNGLYICRNAPLPESQWHIVLSPGASTQVPCVIPLSSPSTLPIHTFTQVETGTDGQGRVLVDNLTPFQGTSTSDAHH
jgi:hypothetical protein